jgi:palmitoyltransferase
MEQGTTARGSSAGSSHAQDARPATSNGMRQRGQLNPAAALAAPARTRPRGNRSGPRRVFQFHHLQFQVPTSCADASDWIQDVATLFLEKIAYFMGPLLIMLALCIVSLLTYTFVTILVPMMLHAYSDHLFWGYVVVSLHSATVIFFLFQILFNYYCCVMAQHDGAEYQKVVRELAVQTAFDYPESPAQLAQYQQDFHDKLVIRIQRRRERAAELQRRKEQNGSQDLESQHVASPISLAASKQDETVAAPVSSNGATDAAERSLSSIPPPPPQLRTWMLLGPFEWGYCQKTQQPKPPRSHYDHVTKLLVLNLDHYCPWMFNSGTHVRTHSLSGLFYSHCLDSLVS